LLLRWSNDVGMWLLWDEVVGVSRQQTVAMAARPAWVIIEQDGATAW
jgi:hypothetical protein